MNEHELFVIAAAPVNSDDELSCFLDLLKAARIISNIKKCRVRALIWGSNCRDYARHLAETTGLHVSASIQEELFASPREIEALAAHEAEKTETYAVVFDHSILMCAVASAAAMSTGSRCITGVESIEIKGERILFNRAVFNGKLIAAEAEDDRRIFLTVTTGAFKKRDDLRVPGNGAVELLPAGASDSRMKITGLENISADDCGLGGADVIVSVGRGIGGEENIKSAVELAAIFKNSALGASRTVCDAEWLPYSHQIGVTGRTVSPRLYLACGISGAQQHVAGMKESSLIISINNDRMASIFSISDYIVVEDIKTFIPLLIEAYRKR